MAELLGMNGHFRILARQLLQSAQSFGVVVNDLALTWKYIKSQCTLPTSSYCCGHPLSGYVGAQMTQGLHKQRQEPEKCSCTSSKRTELARKTWTTPELISSSCSVTCTLQVGFSVLFLLSLHTLYRFTLSTHFSVKATSKTVTRKTSFARYSASPQPKLQI